MCESIEIRFVHLMEHSDYPEVLGVGCICAEHMDQDYIGPSLREKKLRSKAQRRKTWANRNWHNSAKGNFYLNTEGFNLTVFETSRAAPHRWGIKSPTVKLGGNNSVNAGMNPKTRQSAQRLMR